MSYYVEEILLLHSNNSRVMYNIIEKDSELTVFTTRDENESRSMCRSLNLGSGFNGNTPSFFCTTYPNIG